MTPLTITLTLLGLLTHSLTHSHESMERQKQKKTNFWDTFHSFTSSLASKASASEGVSECVSGKAAGVYDCHAIDLLGFIALEDMGCGAFNNEQASAGYANDIWGWTSTPSLTHSHTQEIAIVGCSTGTSFVDITDPLRPHYVGFLRATHSHSYWRDMKVYGDYVYVGSESSRHGVQVMYLGSVSEDALANKTGIVYSATHVYYGVGSSHNLFVNEDSGYLYVLGSDECSGGLHVADVLSSAEEPTFVTCYDGSGYIHDVHCVMYHGPDTRYTDKEICLVFTGRDIRLLDVSDKCNVVVISTATYSAQSFVHQGWWTSDHTHFVMGDEDDELKYGVATRSLLWDATDLTHVVVVHDYRAGTGAIDHNQYIHRNYIWQSNYCAGLRVLNITDDMKLTEVGSFDVSTHCSASNQWLGSWSNFPFFASGNIAVTSIELGLFILKPQFDTTTFSADFTTRASESTSERLSNVSSARPQCAPHPTSLSSLYSTRPSTRPTHSPTLTAQPSSTYRLSTTVLTAVVCGSVFVVVSVGIVLYNKVGVWRSGVVATEMHAAGVSIVPKEEVNPGTCECVRQ